MSCPVKYAVEELAVEEFVDYEYKIVVKGYIVSKCYWLYSQVYRDNTGKITGEVPVVQFPYSRFRDFLTYRSLNAGSKRGLFPSLPYYEERCNSDCVEILGIDLYDNIEDAILDADAKNTRLRGEQLNHAPGGDRYFEFASYLDSMLEVVKDYEKFVTENTTDMVVTSDKCK